jgi:hypothetical protein
MPARMLFISNVRGKKKLCLLLCHSHILDSWGRPFSFKGELYSPRHCSHKCRRNLIMLVLWFVTGGDLSLITCSTTTWEWDAPVVAYVAIVEDAMD